MQTETQVAPSELPETLFYREGDRALEQVVHGACGICFLGDTGKLFGYGPGQPALDVPS